MTSKKEANTYVAGIVAILVFLAVLFAGFGYSFGVFGDPDEISDVIYSDEDGVSGVDPGSGMATPSGPPIFDEPSAPPPA